MHINGTLKNIKSKISKNDSTVVSLILAFLSLDVLEYKEMLNSMLLLLI